MNDETPPVDYRGVRPSVTPQPRAWNWGKKILPPEQEQTLSGIEAKRQQSNATFAQLQQKLAGHPNPELHQRLADIGSKMGQSTQLLGKLRYSLEFRHELKRMALKPEDVRGLMPSRDTKWGEVPLFVIGLRDRENREHLFLRPIRVQR